MDILTPDEMERRGIYRILNITNNKEYIGKSNMPFWNRYDWHVHDLEHNQHSNKPMQRDYNHGGTFVFEVLKSFYTVNPDDLATFEDHYLRESLERKGRDKIYNIRLNVLSEHHRGNPNHVTQSEDPPYDPEVEGWRIEYLLENDIELPV